MSAKFTPGPWTLDFEPYEDRIPYIRISAGKYGMFEDDIEQGFNITGIASKDDGLLIVSAPELYEALRELCDQINGGDFTHARLIAKDRGFPALAKARGEQVTA